MNTAYKTAFLTCHMLQCKFLLRIWGGGACSTKHYLFTKMREYFQNYVLYLEGTLFFLNKIIFYLLHLNQARPYLDLKTFKGC